MSDFFEKLGKKYGFTFTREPIALRGGFMHKMYALYTEKGKYAVKLLNPFVMKREEAMRNLTAAETLEARLEKKRIPILPALSFDGRKMQEIDGQYFYLFDYFDGKALSGYEITEYHCGEMGAVLAAIHGIDKKRLAAPPDPVRIDWDFYARELEKKDYALYDLLCENYDLLLKSEEKGNLARKKLPLSAAICHNDMDSKNVLWRGDEYRIIDLECLSYNYPQRELFELALCWSGYEECVVRSRLIQAFLTGYRRAGGGMPDDWALLYDCNNGRLEWLEYNIKRVLGIDCGADEREMGIGQVKETMRHIVYYENAREQILAACAGI